MADRLEEVTEEVRGKFDRLDDDVMDMGDNRTRMKLPRQIAEPKETTVPYLPAPRELRAFAERDDGGRFESFAASDPGSKQVKTAADEVARDLACEYGVDEEATVERYAGPAPSRGLARQFTGAEERERGESRARSEANLESLKDRQTALEQMRDELQNVYREGRAIVDERRAEMAERLEDRGFSDRDAERPVRDGASEDQRRRDLEQIECGQGAEVRNRGINTLAQCGRWPRRDSEYRREIRSRVPPRIFLHA